MLLKEHCLNVLWITTFYLIGMFVTTEVVLPMQSLLVPNLGTFAALIFPIHGVRVLCAWMFGWWSVPYLFLANVLMALFYALIAKETPYLEFSSERLMSWALVSVVALIAIELFKSAGMHIGKGVTQIGRDTWRQLLLIGFVSSVLNSIGHSLIFSGQIIESGQSNVMIGYLVGDTSGTLACFFILLLLFRWYRWFAGLR